MNGDVCLLAYAVVFVPAMIYSVYRAIDAIRSRNTRRVYASLPPQTCELILDRIEAAGRGNSDCSILVATSPDVNPIDIAGSHYGGAPYAEIGDEWPTSPSHAEPAEFLVQVRLDDSFPSPWPGRLVVVFSRQSDLTIRSYPLASPERAVSMAGTPELQLPWSLRHIHAPRQPGATPGRRGLLDYDPAVLLQTVPGLQADLQIHTRRAVDLLGMILVPNHYRAWGFELSDVVQLGGEPVWMFNDPGDQRCDRCSRVMRFLFQFGDLNGGAIFGDSGVCYVFGCDEHPDYPRGLLQLQ